MIGIALIYQISKRHRIINFLNLLHDFDTRASPLEVKMCRFNMRKKILTFMMAAHLPIIFTSTTTSLIYEFNQYYASVDATLPLCYSFILSYMTLWSEQFSFAALALRSRFELLNRNLKFTFECGKIREIAAINLHSTHGKKNLAKFISELHSQLCDGIEMVNEAFTLQLVPLIIYQLTANLFTLYGLIREILVSSSFAVVAICTNLVWICITTFVLSLGIYSAETTRKSARKTSNIVGFILKTEKFKDVEDIFKTFLLDAQFRSTSFQNEFFCIEWKLLLQVQLLNMLCL